MEGKTQETAAAKAGMSVRSARKWQSGPLPSQAKPEHRWRTRPDPFDGVWEDEIEPLLRNDPTGKLKATTIIDWLAEQHPGRFSASQLRTLQRRLQDWRALHGPDREACRCAYLTPPSSPSIAIGPTPFAFPYPSSMVSTPATIASVDSGLDSNSWISLLSRQ